MSLKQNRIIKIVMEFVKAGTSYDITGIDLGLAKFFYREPQMLFQDLAAGDYTISTGGGKQTLTITNPELLAKIEAFQVAYVLDFDASKYDTQWNVDINTLKDKYNQLLDVTFNVWEYVRKIGFVADDTDMQIILPQLNTGEVWVKTDSGWRGLNAGDIESNINAFWVEFNKKTQEILEQIVTAGKVQEGLLEDFTQQKIKEINEEGLKLEVTQVGHGFIFNAVQFDKTTGAYTKADVNTGADGIAVRIDDDRFYLSSNGIIEIPANAVDSKGNPYELDEYYFLDNEVAGGCTPEKPTHIFQALFCVVNKKGVKSALVEIGDPIDLNPRILVDEINSLGIATTDQVVLSEPTIADLIASKKYKVGDVVHVLGYYSAGDGGGHPRQKKPQGYNLEDAVIGADGSIWAIVQCGEVNASWFGAKGDGIMDNSDIIQKLFDYSSKRTASDIKFNSGTYLCLKSVTIEETQQAELSYFKIEGTGYEHYDRGVNLRLNNETKILFRNLGHNRGGFEFLGKDNGWATSIQMRNIDLTATDNSNHKWSSAIKIGSSIASVFERCTFQGKNGANVISGIDPFTYAFINTAFRNCFFESDVASGFSIFNGVIFSNNTTYSPNDNTVYSECLFEGTAMFFSYQEKLVNCMHYCRTDRVEPNYVFTVEKDGVAPFFDGYTVNFKNNLYIGSSSSMSIQGTYFEDYENAIVVYPFKGSLVERVNIIGCHFSRFKNVQPDYPESTRQILIKEALRNEGAVESVYLSNNTFLGRALETVYSENKDVTVIEMFNYFKEGEPFKIDGVYNRLLSTEEGAFDSKEFIFDKVYINGYGSTAYYSELNIQYLQAQRSSNIKYIEFATDKTLLGKTVNLVLTNGGVEFQWPVDTSSGLQIGSNFLYRLYPLPSYTNYKIKKDNLVSCGIYSADGNIETRGVISIVTGY